MNSVFSFSKCFVSFSAAGFCLKNLAFARKILALSDSGGTLSPNPPAHTPMQLTTLLLCKLTQNNAELRLAEKREGGRVTMMLHTSSWQHQIHRERRWRQTVLLITDSEVLCCHEQFLPTQPEHY